MRSTRLRQRVNAPRASVYRALLDARASATWMVPDGMTSHVHDFDPHEGGAFRVSLTYDEPTGAGKPTAQNDTYHGRAAYVEPAKDNLRVSGIAMRKHSLPAQRKLSMSTGVSL